MARIETLEEAKVVAQAIKDGRVTGENRATLMQALRDFSANEPQQQADTPPAAPAAPAAKSYLSREDSMLGNDKRVAKALGWLGVKAAKGGLGLFGLAADLPANLIDGSAALISRGKAGRVAPQWMRPGENFQAGLESLNPLERTSGEQLAGAAVEGLAGGGGSLALGKHLTKAATTAMGRGAGETLAIAPKTQMAASVAAPVASEGVRQGGGGDGAQLAAAIGAGMVVPTPSALAKTGISNRFTGQTGADAITARELKVLAGSPQSRSAVVDRLNNPEQWVPGRQPTSGEALAGLSEGLPFQGLQAKIARIGNASNGDDSPITRFAQRNAQQEAAQDKFLAQSDAKSLPDMRTAIDTANATTQGAARAQSNASQLHQQIASQFKRMKQAKSQLNSHDNYLKPKSQEQSAALQADMDDAAQQMNAARQQLAALTSEPAAINAKPNAVPMDEQALIAKIAATRDEPGNLSRDGVKQVMDGLIARIENSVAKQGYLDAKEAHAMRMNIGKDLRAAFQGAKVQPDKKLLAKLERPFQEEIDLQIQQAGGVTWDRFLKEFSSSRKKVSAETDRNKQFMKESRSVNIDMRPFNDATGGKIGFNPLDPTISKINYVLSKLKGNQAPRVTNNLADAALDPKKLSGYLTQMPDKEALRRQFIAAALQSAQQGGQ